MTPAGSPGTASDGYRVEKPVGRHRAPPTIPAPRAPTVIAVAAAVLTAASLVAIAAAAVTPDARAAGVHGTTVATTARETRTVLTAGPLEVPTVGVVAPAVESLYPTPSAPPQHTAAVSRGTRTSQTAPEALSGPLVAITTPPQQTVTPATPAVTPTAAETTPTAPPVEIAAATTTSSATPTEEPTVTPTAQPTATVDVAAGVAGP